MRGYKYYKIFYALRLPQNTAHFDSTAVANKKNYLRKFKNATKPHSSLRKSFSEVNDNLLE